MDQGHIIELVALLLTAAGMVVAMGWQLVRLINAVKDNLGGAITTIDDKRSQGVKDLHIKIDDTAASLDKKFNTVRDEISSVKDNYVRRDDLNAHLFRLEKGIDDLKHRFDEGFLEIVRAMSSEKKT